MEYKGIEIPDTLPERFKQGLKSEIDAITRRFAYSPNVMNHHLDTLKNNLEDFVASTKLTSLNIETGQAKETLEQEKEMN